MRVFSLILVLVVTLVAITTWPPRGDVASLTLVSDSIQRATQSTAPYRAIAVRESHAVSDVYTVEVLISPARCGPVQVNGTSEANASTIELPVGNFPLLTPTCPNEEPFPSVLSGGGVVVNPLFTQIAVEGNGSLTVTYFAPLNTAIHGSSSVQTGTIVAYSVTINGGDQSYFELWSFGDGTSLVNATGGLVATHEYSHPGTYTVQVWVNDTEPVRSLSQLKVVVSGAAVGSGTTSDSKLLGLGLLAAGLAALAAAAALAIRRPRREPSLQETATAPQSEVEKETKDGSATDTDGGPSPRDEGERGHI